MAISGFKSDDDYRAVFGPSPPRERVQKAHIFFRHGRWWYSYYERVASGTTPKEAQANWMNDISSLSLQNQRSLIYDGSPDSSGLWWSCV